MNKDRFDESEPNKYNCIQVDDDFIWNEFLTDLQSIDCYWHTLEVAGKVLHIVVLHYIHLKSMGYINKNFIKTK